MITKTTAMEIWMCFDEIQKGEALLADLEKQLKDSEVPLARDAFGRRRNLSLGIPSSSNGERIFDVHPALGMAVIKAHIAEKRSVLLALNETARAELLEASTSVFLTAPASSLEPPL